MQGLHRHPCYVKIFSCAYWTFLQSCKFSKVEAHDLDLWWGHILINNMKHCFYVGIYQLDCYTERKGNELIGLRRIKWHLVTIGKHFFVSLKHFTFLFILASLHPPADKWLTIWSWKQINKTLIWTICSFSWCDTPTITNFKVPSDVTNHGIKKRCTQLTLMTWW